jgi:hypothetical protein
MPALMARRGELLDALGSNETVRARDIVAALVVPLAELVSERGVGGERYLRFLARAFEERELDFEFVRTRFASGTEPLEPLLLRALPELPVERLRLRLAFALEGLLRGLANRTQLHGWRDDAAQLDMPSYAAELIDFITGGLEAGSRLEPSVAAPARRSARGEAK